jgi:hypothetical protein
MVIRLPSFNDDYARDRFIQGQRPLFWRKQSRELAEAAEIIIRSHTRTEKDQKQGRRYRRRVVGDIWQGIMNPISYQPAYLLYAFAIENAIKGIVVGRDNKLIAEDKLDDLFMRTGHDLNKICRMRRIDMNEVEADILTKLTQTIKWAGRYPTPNRKDDMLPAGKDGKRTHAGLDYWSNDREKLRLLYQRLDKELCTLLRDDYSEASVMIPDPPRRRSRIRVQP